VVTQHADGFQLTLPIFEGPLDLLLHLIEREELDITNIALVTVADQYMQYLHEADKINLDQLADFIYIGARLLFIKSCALLPRSPTDAIIDDDEEDPGRVRSGGCSRRASRRCTRHGTSRRSWARSARSRPRACTRTRASRRHLSCRRRPASMA